MWTVLTTLLKALASREDVIRLDPNSFSAKEIRYLVETLAIMATKESVIPGSEWKVAASDREFCR